MNHKSACPIYAFIRLKERCEQFLLDIIDTSPGETGELAIEFLNRARSSIEQYATAYPSTGTEEEAEEKLLSLQYFQQHINHSRDATNMTVEELNQTMARLSEDAVLLLTELWSVCKDSDYKKILHELLQLEKEQLVKLVSRSD